MRVIPVHLHILTLGLVVAGCGETEATPAPAVGGDNGVGGSTESGGSANAANWGTSTVAQGGGVVGGSHTGGMPGTAGARTGGAPGTGGASTSSTSTVNCSGTMPTGGTSHAANSQGTAAGLSWQVWSNQTSGTITTFSTPAFSATWNNSGDFLARLGLTWNNTKTYDQLGTITAQFAETKTGTGGGYSYIGIYGWSVTPCIEWYIVDDSYNTMPVNPGSDTLKGTVTIDGGTYNLYTRATTGTGGSNCGSSVSSWNQFYSIRQTARQCGQISITQHFAAWAAAGMTLGLMNEAQVLIEVGGGSGTINFSTANVTAQ